MDLKLRYDYDNDDNKDNFFSKPSATANYFGVFHLLYFTTKARNTFAS